MCSIKNFLLILCLITLGYLFCKTNFSKLEMFDTSNGSDAVSIADANGALNDAVITLEKATDELKKINRDDNDAYADAKSKVDSAKAAEKAARDVAVAIPGTDANNAAKDDTTDSDPVNAGSTSFDNLWEQQSQETRDKFCGILTPEPESCDIVKNKIDGLYEKFQKCLKEKSEIYDQ